MTTASRARAEDVTAMSVKRFFAFAATGIAPIVIFLLLPMGTWADLADLPMHPLIVHGVIVALPLAAVWILAAAWKPAVLRRTYALGWALSVAAALGVIAAKSSGDSLAAAVGLPDAHADAGNRLVPVSITMAGTVLAMVFFSMVRPVRLLVPGARALGSIAAVVALPLTYLAGHSGAASVWEEQYAEARQPISPDRLTLSMEEVRRHDTPGDCWTVVRGNVYDVTTFVARHPAGSGAIEEMCGKDAGDDFLGEHDGQGEPERWLATLKIGVLRD
jgi:hypothetical protein